MKILQFSLGVLSTLFLMSTSCAQSESLVTKKNSALALSEHHSEPQCHSDNDCITLKSSCCGCNEGGKQRALAKSLLEVEQDKLTVRCDDVVCMQVISHDKSCSQKAVCEAGQCILR